MLISKKFLLNTKFCCSQHSSKSWEHANKSLLASTVLEVELCFVKVYCLLRLAIKSFILQNTWNAYKKSENRICGEKYWKYINKPEVMRSETRTTVLLEWVECDEHLGWDPLCRLTISVVHTANEYNHRESNGLKAKHRDWDLR